MFLVSVWDQQLFPRSLVTRHEGLCESQVRQAKSYISNFILAVHVPVRDYDNKRIVLDLQEVVSLNKQLCNCPYGSL